MQNLDSVLNQYQCEFMDWWDANHALHCSFSVKDQPLPDDRPYHWSTLESMDNDVVLMLFVLHCERQLPFTVWHWLHTHIEGMRMYHRHSKLKPEKEVDQLGSHSYSYFES